MNGLIILFGVRNERGPANHYTTQTGKDKTYTMDREHHSLPQSRSVRIIRQEQSKDNDQIKLNGVLDGLDYPLLRKWKSTTLLYLPPPRPSTGL